MVCCATPFISVSLPANPFAVFVIRHVRHGSTANFCPGRGTIMNQTDVFILDELLKTRFTPHRLLRVDLPVGDGVGKRTVELNFFTTVQTYGFDLMKIARRG